MESIKNGFLMKKIRNLKSSMQRCSAMLLELVLLCCVDGQEQIFFDVSHCLLDGSTVFMSVCVHPTSHVLIGQLDQRARGTWDAININKQPYFKVTCFIILAHLDVFLLAVLRCVFRSRWFWNKSLRRARCSWWHKKKHMKNPFKFSLFGVCTNMCALMLSADVSHFEIHNLKGTIKARDICTPNTSHLRRCICNLRVTQWNLWVLQLVGPFCHVMAGKPETWVEVLEQAENMQEYHNGSMMKYVHQLC